MENNLCALDDGCWIDDDVEKRERKTRTSGMRHPILERGARAFFYPDKLKVPKLKTKFTNYIHTTTLHKYIPVHC